MTPPPTAPKHALHVSACAAERRERAAAFLRSLPRGEAALIVVPSPNAGLWLMPEVLSPGEARFDWRRLSLEQHCHALARPALLQAGKSYLSPVAAQALSTRVMLDLAARGELGRFAAVSSHPGFGRALWSTLSELRLARVSPEQLAPHDPDLACIAAAFDVALAERALVDLAALYALAAERARGVQLSALLLFDVPIVHAAEAELVRAIAARCERACATIALGDNATLDALRVAFPRASEETTAPRAPGELGRLQAHLFERDLHEAMPVPGSLDTSEAPPPDLEPAKLPESKKRWQRRGGTPRDPSGPSSIQGDLFAALSSTPPADTTPETPAADSGTTAQLGDPATNPETAEAVSGTTSTPGGPGRVYTDKTSKPHETADPEDGAGGAQGSHADASRVHFVSSPGESRECVEVARAVLAAARSGVAFDRMAVLVRAVDNYRSFLEEALARAAIPAHYAAGVRRPAPEGRAFGLLLRCADSGLSVRRFAEYLSLGVMPRPEQTESAAVSPRYWERLLLQAQVGGHSAHWAHQLDQLGARWREQLQLLAADDAERETQQKRVDALQSLRDFAVPLLQAIEALPERASFDHYREQLSALAALALDKPAEVQALLAELSPLDHAQLGRRELVQMLSSHLNSLIVPSEGSGAGKLQVLPVEEARGRSFDRVFVVGLAEKLMPPRLREDPLLPDEVRARVSPALARMPDRVASERLALRIALSAAREHLHLSFPRFDAEQGRPRVPSFYGLEILEAVDGRLPAWSELGERASQGAAARLGWPAPDDPEQAVDAAEYDLAVIARARGNAARAAGALRYLMASNPHLARALRFRARRWELQKFVAADGFIVTDDSARELLRDYLNEHPYSPSALELLAICPYRFYLRSIARVTGPEREASVAALDARERGVLFHQLLHETLTQLTDSTAPRALEPDAAQALLDDVLARLRAERCARDPQRARLVELELRSLRADLAGFLHEQARAGEWLPRASELRFGEAGGSAKITVAGVLPLSGAIDLVEQSSAPSSPETPQLRATDFKTGGMHEALERGRARSITAHGRVLQPLLYALALEQLFPEAQVRGGRLYYCTRKEHYESFSVELNERTREIATQLAHYIDDLVSRGFLPAAPDPPDACTRCEYQVICGPHEAERVQKKNRDFGKLRSLNLLRGLS